MPLLSFYLFYLRRKSPANISAIMLIRSHDYSFRIKDVITKPLYLENVCSPVADTIDEIDMSKKTRSCKRLLMSCLRKGLDQMEEMGRLLILYFYTAQYNSIYFAGSGQY